MDWYKRIGSKTVTRKVVTSAFVSVLAIGCADLTACNGPVAGEEDGVELSAGETVAAPETYTVTLETPTGAALVEALQDDEGQADLAAKISSAEVSVDEAAAVVDMTVVVDGGDVEELTGCAEALGRALSDRAQVTAADGSAASDDGPCGALYEAYDLIARVYNGTTGEFFDGTLTAGGSEVMWQ